MADRWGGGGIRAGSTSASTSFLLRSATDGTEVTGKVAADLTASYRRQGGTRTSISLSDLAAIDSAWSSGGVKEDAGGLYRLDLPDAALTASGGADFVMIEVSCSGAYIFHERIPLPTDATLAAVKAVTDSLTIVGGKISAQLTAAGDFAQGAADKVWATATRLLTGFGFTVSLAQSVWAETPSTGAGTAGQLLTAAGVASDPLLNTVPGTYNPGTAGYVIGNISSDAANIAAIKTKTDQLTFSNPGVVDANASGGVTPAAVAAAVLNTAMTEGYAADGAQATLTQALYLIMQSVIERSVSGTTVTIKKLDGTTTAATLQTNSATNPTAVTRTA